jgi:hypothetical protein
MNMTKQLNGLLKKEKKNDLFDEEYGIIHNAVLSGIVFPEEENLKKLAIEKIRKFLFFFPIQYRIALRVSLNNYIQATK